MPVCATCKKWHLLAGKCSVCTSAERLWAACTSDRLPATAEAEAKVTKCLDGAFYSISRLVPDSEEEAEKGAAAPSKPLKKKEPKGEASPRATEVEKKEKGRKPDSPPVRSQKSDSSKEERSEKKVNIKEEKQKPIEPSKSEGNKVLPKKKEDEEQKKPRSRTPLRQKEKDKRKKDKKESRSLSVSGSRTRKKKREDHSPQKAEVREGKSEARPSSGIQREAYLRPRPSQREARSPRTPDHPPPRTSLIPPATGRGVDRGQGWRGPIPYSSHPRWSEGTNKGVTKRAKQELYDRKQSRGRW